MSKRWRRLASLMAAGILTSAMLPITPAHADSLLLPMPGSFSCLASDGASGGTWTLRRLIVTTSATITSAQSLMLRDASAGQTVIDIRANDGTVGTSSWTILGSLSQTSETASGLQFLVSYTGSISLTPGTYWVGARKAPSSTALQSICLTDSPSSQSPWSIDTSTIPKWYATNNSGSSYFVDAGSAAYVPFISLTAEVNGGGGDDSNSVSAPAPTFALTLTPTDGTTCSNTDQSAAGGTWLTLPSADDCTPPTSRAGATLLGWSTTPDFPIAIAQRQVTNGWGTYETFNSLGVVTSVFIPAGAATFISEANNLYPIWNE